MATTKGRGRLSKTALKRAKLAAVAVSVVAFVSSLAGVVIANPGVKQAQVASTLPATNIVVPASVVPSAPVPLVSSPAADTAPLVIPQMPQMPQAPMLRPFARTRGS